VFTALYQHGHFEQDKHAGNVVVMDCMIERATIQQRKRVKKGDKQAREAVCGDGVSHLADDLVRQGHERSPARTDPLV